MEPKKVYGGDFEFELSINSNIICKRVFEVHNFNENAFRSHALKQHLDETVALFQERIKSESIDYLWRHYDPYGVVDDEGNVIGGTLRVKANQPDEKEYFTFRVKHKGRVFSERIFDATIYPHEVRYRVDIRDLVSGVIYRFQKALSARNPGPLFPMRTSKEVWGDLIHKRR